MLTSTSNSASLLQIQRTRASVDIPIPVYPEVDPNEAFAGGTMDMVRQRLTAEPSGQVEGRILNTRLQRPKSEYNLCQEARFSARSARLQERLEVSMAGIRKLDILREKHRRMIQDIKSHISSDPSSYNDSRAKSADLNHRSSLQLQEDQESPGYKHAGLVSPPPTEAGSHRSSASIDSGIISLASDQSILQSYQLGQTTAGSDCTYLSLRESVASTPLTTPSQSEAPSGDDEGIYSDINVNSIDSSFQPAQYYQILNVEQSPVPSPTSPVGYWRQRSSRSLQSRPKSLYSYPEENTVLVKAPHIASIQVSAAPPIVVSSDSILSPPASPIRVQYPPPLQTVGHLPIMRHQSGSGGSIGYIKRSPVQRRISEIKYARETDAIYRASYQNPESNRILRQRMARCPSLSVLSEKTSDTGSTFLKPDMTRHTPICVSVLSNHTDILASMPRPKSLALPIAPKPAATWDDVKRILDPNSLGLSSGRRSSSMSHLHYLPGSTSPCPTNSRARPSLMRCKSNVSNNSGDKTPTLQDRWDSEGDMVKVYDKSHEQLSRTVSEQSSDSSKSRRNREKTWHESDEL